MQVDVERLRAEQVAELRRSRDAFDSDALACFSYVVAIVVSYFVIRQAVYRGILLASARQDADRLKAAEKAERAVQAQRQATQASATRSSASPRSTPPGASGTPRKA